MNIFKKKQEKQLVSTKDLYLARIKDNLNNDNYDYIIAQIVENQKDKDNLYFMDINTRFIYTYNDNTIFETIDTYIPLTDEDTYVEIDYIYKIAQNLIKNDKSVRIRK